MRSHRTPRTPPAETIDELPALRLALVQAQRERDELAEQLKTARALLQMQAQPHEPKAERDPCPGYLVVTPSPHYSGEVMGVRFERGQGYIPAGEGAEAKAVTMAEELGYSVLYLEDYTAPFERPEPTEPPPAFPPDKTPRDLLRELFQGDLL